GDLRSRIGEVPDAQPIYVICRAGGRSAQAAAWLNHIGKQAINVGGRMQSWAAAGRPVVSETGMPPYVACRRRGPAAGPGAADGARRSTWRSPPRGPAPVRAAACGFFTARLDRA